MEQKQIALEVMAEIAEVEIEQLLPETELVAHLGIDSPRALQMLIELEDRLDIEIADDEVERMETVGDVLEAVSGHRK